MAFSNLPHSCCILRAAACNAAWGVYVNKMILAGLVMATASAIYGGSASASTSEPCQAPNVPIKVQTISSGPKPNRLRISPASRRST